MGVSSSGDCTEEFQSCIQFGRGCAEIAGFARHQPKIQMRRRVLRIELNRVVERFTRSGGFTKDVEHLAKCIVCYFRIWTEAHSILQLPDRLRPLAFFG